jgi:hypothetical protein
MEIIGFLLNALTRLPLIGGLFGVTMLEDLFSFIISGFKSMVDFIVMLL